MSDNGDQAGKLRELAGPPGAARSAAAQGEPEAATAVRQTRTLAITSGKGGVGKTNTVINLALSFAHFGQRVVLLDADFGLANVDILLGLTPKLSLRHVVFGAEGERVRLEDIILEGPGGVRIIPASSGIQELTRLTEEQRRLLFGSLSRLSADTDILLIDTSAGISDNVIHLLLAAQEVVLVTCPEPTAIIDAYAVVKVLWRQDVQKPVKVVVNMASSEREGQEVFEQLSGVVDKFLGRRLEYLGAVLRDDNVGRAVRQQKPLVVRFPNSVASHCFRGIARQLLQVPPGLEPRRGFRDFVRQLVGRR